MAADLGADAIIVSNHGGRQLDGALSRSGCWPQIVRAVGDRVEIWVDGGIRTGQDVLKALAMGAKGTISGGPISMALARWASRGDRRAERDQEGNGHHHGPLRRRTIDQIDRSMILVPEDFEGRWQGNS